MTISRNGRDVVEVKVEELEGFNGKGGYMETLGPHYKASCMLG